MSFVKYSFACKNFFPKQLLITKPQTLLSWKIISCFKSCVIPVSKSDRCGDPTSSLDLYSEHLSCLTAADIRRQPGFSRVKDEYRAPARQAVTRHKTRKIWSVTEPTNYSKKELGRKVNKLTLTIFSADSHVINLASWERGRVVCGSSGLTTRFARSLTIHPWNGPPILGQRQQQRRFSSIQTHKGNSAKIATRFSLKVIPTHIGGDTRKSASLSCLSRFVSSLGQ